MPKLFGLDIAGIINSEIKAAGGVLSGVLTKIAAGTRTGAALTKGTNPTEKRHTFNGFYDDKRLQYLPETTVRAGDRVAVLLGASIQGGAVPQPGDFVTLEGETTRIEKVVERDPAAATYACQVRRT